MEGALLGLRFWGWGCEHVECGTQELERAGRCCWRDRGVVGLRGRLHTSRCGPLCPDWSSDLCGQLSERGLRCAGALTAGRRGPAAGHQLALQRRDRRLQEGASPNPVLLLAGTHGVPHLACKTYLPRGRVLHVSMSPMLSWTLSALPPGFLSAGSAAAPTVPQTGAGLQGRRQAGAGHAAHDGQHAGVQRYSSAAGQHPRDRDDGVHIAVANGAGQMAAAHVLTTFPPPRLQGSGMKGSLYNRDEAMQMAGMGGGGEDDEDEVPPCSCKASV